MNLKLYIGCLPADATNNELLTTLALYAPTASVEVGTKKGKCVGSGSAVASTLEAYKTLLTSEIFFRERKLQISAFLSAENLAETHRSMNLRKIMVRSLYQETTDQELFEAFKIFGKIVNAFMSSDRKADTKKPMNYGFVIFENELSAYKALMGHILVKNRLVKIKLFRFKDVGDSFYTVEGKKIFAKDLI